VIKELQEEIDGLKAKLEAVEFDDKDVELMVLRRKVE
jgi:hypothetical protein